MVKNSPASARDARDLSSTLGLGRSPTEGNGNPLQYFLLGKLCGQKSLVSYSPWGHKELDIAEHAHATSGGLNNGDLSSHSAGSWQVPNQGVSRFGFF